MSDRTESPWNKQAPANDNEDQSVKGRGNRTQPATVICDLSPDPGIIEGEADLLARFLVQIIDEFEAANDNEASGEN